MTTVAKILSPPVYCHPSTSILNASLLMKERRTHCLLIIDDKTGKLTGLTTTKDLAFKAFADNSILISEVMSKDPYFVPHLTSVNDALKLMVIKKIRHLPIVNDQETVIGILDITTCFYNAMIRLEQISLKSKELQSTFDNLNSDSNVSSRKNSDTKLGQGTMKTPSTNTISQLDNSRSRAEMYPKPVGYSSYREGFLDFNISKRKKNIINELKSLIELMNQPDLNSLLADNELNVRKPFYIDAKTSIWDASQQLLKNNITAALIVQNNDLIDYHNVTVEEIIGIITTKDLVYRVLSCQLNPKQHKVARIMTSKPEFVNDSMAVHNALRLMYEGKFLNLPIINAENRITGLVNVLDLTYSLLNLLNNNSVSKSDPDLQTTNISAWNSFWDSLDKPINGYGRSHLPELDKPKPEFPPTNVNIMEISDQTLSSEKSFIEVNFSPKTHSTVCSPLPFKKSTTIIKVKILEDDGVNTNSSIYKFETNESESDFVDRLYLKIIRKYKKSVKENIELGYYDKEHDFVLIDSNEDFQLALKSGIHDFIAKVDYKNSLISLNTLIAYVNPRTVSVISGFATLVILLTNLNVLHATE